jgi:hypothetical protein
MNSLQQPHEVCLRRLASFVWLKRWGHAPTTVLPPSAASGAICHPEARAHSTGPQCIPCRAVGSCRGCLLAGARQRHGTLGLRPDPRLGERPKPPRANEFAATATRSLPSQTGLFLCGEDFVARPWFQPGSRAGAGPARGFRCVADPSVAANHGAMESYAWPLLRDDTASAGSACVQVKPHAVCEAFRRCCRGFSRPCSGVRIREAVPRQRKQRRGASRGS